MAVSLPEIDGVCRHQNNFIFTAFILPKYRNTIRLFFYYGSFYCSFILQNAISEYFFGTSLALNIILLLLII
jgi:hypothetical protein